MFSTSKFNAAVRATAGLCSETSFPELAAIKGGPPSYQKDLVELVSSNLQDFSSVLDSFRTIAAASPQGDAAMCPDARHDDTTTAATFAERKVDLLSTNL